MGATPIAVEERVWRVTAGAFPSNCYVVAIGGTHRCAIVDPGLDGPSIERALDALRLEPAAVLCTHGHFDHAGSAARFQREHGCAVYLHADDVKTLRASNFLLMAFKIDARIEVPEVTPIDARGLFVDVAGQTFTFHPTPGHTPGSCVVHTGDSLFTGDTLYARGVGLSKLPGERPAELRRSIESLWDRFAPLTKVHPGHGESATLGWIREHNSALRQFLETADDTPA